MKKDSTKKFLARCRREVLIKSIETRRNDIAEANRKAQTIALMLAYCKSPKSENAGGE